MLRQLYIFHFGKIIYSHSFALGLNKEELINVTGAIQPYIDSPMPGKTFSRPMVNYQIFHRGDKSTYFLLVADLIDSIDYVDKIFKNIINSFTEMFPNPSVISEESPVKESYEDVLYQAQADLHSKIAIAGPVGSGKSTLYNLLKDPNCEERSIMNFAKTFNFSVGKLKFDVWNFQLKENFSLMWSKHISGSDLVILIIDLSNYSLKVIKHFLDFQKQEGKHSKYLLLGNKRDLVSEEDIIHIKNELERPDIEMIALNQSEAQETVMGLIRKALKLKKPLPPNFKTLMEEAKNLEAQNQLATALIKYKELISIAYNFQAASYIREFENKLEDLKERREKQILLEKELKSKSKFSKPEPIKFSGPIKVKSLPSMNTTTNTTKATHPMKLKLSPEDIKLSLPRAIEKSNSSMAIPSKEESESSQPACFKPYEKPLVEDIQSIDLAEILHEIIENNGGELSPELCERFITELSDSLQHSLTIEDINLAARYFLEKEREC